jgi:hypothetical protein
MAVVAEAVSFSGFKHSIVELHHASASLI